MTPGVLRSSRIRRVALYRRQLKLAEALPWARLAREEAAARLDPFAEDFVCAELGDLCYRRGALAEAREAFQRCLQIRERIGEPAVRFAMRANLARVARRLGERETALQMLDALNADSDEPVTRAELAALEAAVHADGGDAPRAEAAMNRAIEAAVEVGARDLLLRMANAAGWASLALGDPEQASAAFGQARQLAPPEEMPPAELVHTFLGLAECGALDDAELAGVLPVLPRALGDDAELWWLLPRLVQRLQERLAGASDGPWLLLRRAAAQRMDGAST